MRQSFHNALSFFSRNKKAASSPPARRRAPLWVEALEDRFLMSATPIALLKPALLSAVTQQQAIQVVHPATVSVAGPLLHTADLVVQGGIKAAGNSNPIPAAATY